MSAFASTAVAATLYKKGQPPQAVFTFMPLSVRGCIDICLVRSRIFLLTTPFFQVFSHFTL